MAVGIVLDFVIIAFAIFIVVKAMNLQKKKLYSQKYETY